MILNRLPGKQINGQMGENMYKLGILFIFLIVLTGCSAARPVIRMEETPVRTSAVALDDETAGREAAGESGAGEENKSGNGPTPVTPGPVISQALTRAETTKENIKSASDRSVGSENSLTSTQAAPATTGQPEKEAAPDTKPSDSLDPDDKAGLEATDAAQISAYNLFDYYPLIADRRIDLKSAQAGGSSLLLQYFHEEPGSATAQIRQFSDSAALINVVRITPDQITELYYSKTIPYRHSIMGHTDYEERVILKAPLQKGNKWTSTGLDFEITAVDEQRQINGEVETVLDVLVSTMDEQVLFTYAAGLGLVSNDIIHEDGSRTNIVHYTGLKDGVKDSYDINFHFPGGDGLVSATRRVEFATNDSTREQLTAAYKAIAAEEDFTEVMGPDAQIQYIYLEDGMVHLDLNQAFVDYINEAPELEEIRLQALVDTLAGYYRVEGVKLTVNDQRYESLNRKIEPEELLKPTVPVGPDITE